MRKILLFIVSLSVVSTNCFSQAYPLKVSIKSQTKVDSVLFGLNYNATLGIDTSLGEQNIKDITYDDFEIRVIQRDSINYHCLYNAWDRAKRIYSTNNFDTKIDYRNINGAGNIDDGFFNDICYNYEIIIKSILVPYEIIGDFSQIGAYDWGRMILLDSSCNFVKDTFPYPYEEQNIYTVNDTQKYTLIIHLEHEISVDEQNGLADWNIFPVPAIDKIEIHDMGIQKGKIEFVDILGNIVYSEVLKDEENKVISTNDLISGVYIIRIFNDETKKLSVKMFVKL